MNPVRLAVLAAVLVAAGGCGKSEKAAQPVEGKVLFKGRPTPRAVVMFHPEDGEADPAMPWPLGTVDEQGRFRLTTHTGGDGVPPGSYRVTVVWHLVQRVPGRPDETTTVNYLPPRYSNPATSGLRATVAKGTNSLEAFVLAVP